MYNASKVKVSWRVFSSGIWRRVVRHIPEENTLQNHRCENLKSYMKVSCPCAYLIKHHPMKMCGGVEQ
jgi:hypothetical protein